MEEMADPPAITAASPSSVDLGNRRKGSEAMTLLRTVLFILIGWYLIKWLVRWISCGKPGAGSGKGAQRDDRYESLTDQKIDDADYEDL